MKDISIIFITLFLVVVLYGCKNTGGNASDAVDEFKYCYETLRQSIKKKNNSCFCSGINNEVRNRYTKLLIEKFDNNDEPKITRPAKGASLENVKHVSMWYGGLKINMKYEDETWCISNVFYK